MSSNPLDEIGRKIASGEDAGGCLWLGTPASSPQGQYFENTCIYSEKVWHGQEWLNLSRCPKQIISSCDCCARSLDKPHYQKKGGA